MISPYNQAINAEQNQEDFTLNHYRELVRLAKQKYYFSKYTDWNSFPNQLNRLIWWRHDVDGSINRSVRLAKIEQEEGVNTTYFLNLRSEFYNIFEKSQITLVKEIINLGHDIGLHFDAAFYEIHDINQLELFLEKEVNCLQSMLDVKPVAFSFHSPAPKDFLFEANQYLGLINCYSKRFKEEIGYCSDSNGYWRFRRLYNVLAEAKDSCLQVLTHPECWQDTPMPHRQRIFRCAYERAAATLRTYDITLEQYGRLNHAGAAGALLVLKASQPQRFELCDYLWNQGEFQTLFVELWRLHAEQINRLCKASFRKEWAEPAREVNTFFSSDGLMVDGWKLFNEVFEIPWSAVTAIGEADHQNLQRIYNQIVRGRLSVSPTELEQGCILLCVMIQGLAEWGRAQSISYDGLMCLDSIGLPTLKTPDKHP